MYLCIYITRRPLYIILHASVHYCLSAVTVIFSFFFCFVFLFIYIDYFFFFFFFQAEDGIRDVAVTGVQTRALPIFTAINSWLKDCGLASHYPGFPGTKWRV